MYFPRLRDLREDADLSQKQVAEILHIQQTVYSRYERGYQTIPVEHLLVLADYYHFLFLMLNLSLFGIYVNGLH